MPISEDASNLETGGSPLLYGQASKAVKRGENNRPQYMAEQGRMGQQERGGSLS